MDINEIGKEFDKLIKQVMIINRLAGFWPLDKESGSQEKKLRFLHRILIFSVVISAPFFVAADGIHNRDNTNEVIECILIGSTFCFASVRLIIFALYQKEMLLIITSMKADWMKASLEDSLVLKEKCGLSYKVANVFIFFIYSTLSIFILIPIIESFALDGDREKLPFRGYVFINHTESPTFEIVLAINIASGIFASSTIGAASSFMLVSVIHSAAKFSILQRKFGNLKSSDPNVDLAVVECIEQHQESIRFAEVLEKVISPLALGQFLTSTGLLCFCGLLITTSKTDTGNLMKYIAFLQVAVMELFFFSFSGNQLIEESKAVGESAYSSDWIGSSYTKNLQIIMMRVRNPCKISAEKFYDLSLESFSKVLSTSFSYFTVLQAANE